MHRLLKCLQIRDSGVRVPVQLKYDFENWSINTEQIGASYENIYRANLIYRAESRVSALIIDPEAYVKEKLRRDLSHELYGDASQLIIYALNALGNQDFEGLREILLNIKNEIDGTRLEYY